MAITGVRSITHLYRGGEGWTHPLYLISYEWIFLNNLLQLTNMKLFAALERALLARWRKIKVALKVNKWPLLSLKEQRLQLKKQYLESLFRKKWQKFVKPIYVCSRSHLPHWQQYYTRLFSLIESSDSLETHRNKDGILLGLAVRLVKCGLPFTLMCNMDALDSCVVWVAICWRSSLKTVSSRIRLRLTIMCDSNEMSWIAEILTHSQNRLL